MKLNHMHIIIVFFSFSTLAQAQTIYNYQPSAGNFSTDTNWSPQAVFSSSLTDEYRISDSDQASLSTAIDVSASEVRVGYQGQGTLTVSSGGELSFDILRIGNTVGSQGEVTVNSGGVIRGIVNVGHSGTGTLSVETGGILDANDRDLRLGVFNGAVNSTMINRGSIINGNNFTVYSGTYIHESASATFDQALNFEFATFAQAELRFLGSTGSFQASSLLNPTSESVLSYVFDTSGIVQTELTDSADISGIQLVLDVDALQIGETHTILTAANSLTGAFGSIAVTGAKGATVSYHSNSVSVTVVPEPTSWAMVTGSVLLFFLLRNRPRRD